MSSLDWQHGGRLHWVYVGLNYHYSARGYYAAVAATDCGP